VYEQIYQPVAGSLVLSTVVAAIPILVLFVLLAGLRVAAEVLLKRPNSSR
jgi:lactate permease